MDSNEFKNVHEFDGKWKSPEIPKYPVKQKIKVFNLLKTYLKKTRGLQLIIDDSMNREYNNYEPLSGVYADDLLVEIIKKSKKLDKNVRLEIFEIIEEQLEDMFSLGQCPSGRVSRLIQIYNCLS
jgi:hypothetical protein